MEPLVEELLKNHKGNKDLTGAGVQEEVKELRKKHNRVDPDLKNNEQLVGLDLREASLEDFHFENTKLSKKGNEKVAHFERATLSNAHFEKVDLSYGCINQANVKGTIFEGCNFKGLDFEDSNDFRHARFNRIDESDLSSASREYRNLESFFKNCNMNYRAATFYYRKRITETKSYWIEWCGKIWHIPTLLAAIIHSLWFILCGYCERPKRCLGMMVFIIVFSGFIYHFAWNGPVDKYGNHVGSLWDSLYFSGVTFTTLGFGDLAPDPNIIWMKILAFGEAFAGAFMIALFVITLVRKLSR